MSADFGGMPVEEPKKKSNTTLIIVIVVAVILLCCCCVSAGLLWNYGDLLMENLNF